MDGSWGMNEWERVRMEMDVKEEKRAKSCLFGGVRFDAFFFFQKRKPRGVTQIQIY